MDKQLFRHLNFPTKLAIEFMAVFSRFEYALKSTEFADGGPTKVDPAWDRFANHIHDKFEKIKDDSLKEAVRILLEESPRKQVLIDGKLQL